MQFGITDFFFFFDIAKPRFVGRNKLSCICNLLEHTLSDHVIFEINIEINFQVK